MSNPYSDTVKGNMPQGQTVVKEADKTRFPYPSELPRISNYEFYERLFMGQHFDAFGVRIASENFGKEYAKIRYIAANFPGLISKVAADLLFIEPPKIKVEDGDQDFMDALVGDNKLRVSNYESALSNSYFGDTVFKIRVGYRNPGDKKTTVIIEEITPKIYFPKVDPYNVKATPEETELAWIVEINGKKYLRKEIHKPKEAKIYNQLFELEADKIGAEVGISLLDPNIKSEEPTFTDRSLIVHVPNWRTSGRYFGISDYYDLESLFFAINNRITKIDNILDKHSDPILAIPEGILDENGQVKKSKLGLFERGEGKGKDDDPTYITWDANLESATTEIDKLIDMTCMMSETSPVVVGLDKDGYADSGRALKFKMLRTLAKAQRKQLYYTEGLKELLYTAQIMAKELKLEVDGRTLSKEPVKPEIEWRDGLPADMRELVEVEQMRIDAGLTTKKDAIMRIDDVDEDIAEKKAKEIDEETKLELKAMNVTPSSGFSNRAPNGSVS